MWTMRCPRLLFLLNFFITTCPGAESGFLLKGVTLDIKPAKVVERGSELTLTCDAKVVYSGGNSTLLRFSFIKDYNKLNPVHILQTNTSENATYTITKARASNTGTYQCEVMAKDQYADSSSEKIIIEGLQTPVLNVDKLHVTEGDVVRVICSAKEESGELTFVIKDGSREIYQGKNKIGEVQKNHFLRSVGTAKLSCSYAINLGSEMLHSNISNVVSVVVKELDFMPTIKVLPSTEVIEGDSMHITCGVTGKNYSSPLLSLSKGSRLFPSPERKNPEYKAVVMAADSGGYECSARVNSVEKNVYANLTVKELFSVPLLTITPVEVFERQQFTITCTSSEFASERIGYRDVKYTIYRYNQTLSSVNGTYRYTASTETNGNYTCTAQAKNITKWSHSTIFTAKVLVSRPNITVLGEVVLGRSFQIECYSDSGSFPITYKLTQNHSQLSHTKVSRPSQKAIFAATILSEKEIHEFRCEAQNNGDSVQMSDPLFAQVTVPVEKPTLMTIPEADSIIESTEVEFLCMVEKGTQPITFKWYHDDNPRPVHTDTKLKHHSRYSLPSVSSVHSGRYYCEALNGAGKVEVSNSILITVKMAIWKKGLIIGVCLLGVTGLILALLLRYRAKRAKVSISNGVGIWSARPPVLDSSEVVDVDEPEEPNVAYTEVLHPQTADPAQVPLKKGTDTVYSEVQSP